MKQVHKRKMPPLLQVERKHQKVQQNLKQLQQNKGKEHRCSVDEEANVVDEFNVVYDDEESINFTTNEIYWIIDSVAILMLRLEMCSFHLI